MVSLTIIAAYFEAIDSELTLHAFLHIAHKRRIIGITESQML